MRVATGLLLVLLAGSTLYADREFIYTFWTPGKIHVYLMDPQISRTVTFDIRTFPEDEFLLAGSTRADSPYQGDRPAGTYRIEADEDVVVMVGERGDEACPNFFVYPQAGSGRGAYLYTGDPVCTGIGRAFLYSPDAGARYTFAGGDLLDPVYVDLPPLDHWMEVTDRLFHPITYLRTTAPRGMFQVRQGPTAAGYFVPSSAPGEYNFYASGLDRSPPLFDIPVRLHVVAGEDECEVTLARWVDGRTLTSLWSGFLAPGEEYTRDLLTASLYRVVADRPVVVMVMPASEAFDTSFMQFAYALDAVVTEGPSFGTKFRVPLRPSGYLKLFGGSGTTEVEIYDTTGEFVETVAFENTMTLFDGPFDSGWYLLRSRGERFGVQVGTESGGNTWVPRNIVADVIDRPLVARDLRHYPIEPVPTDSEVYLSCITNQETTSVFYFRNINEDTWHAVGGSVTPSHSHWATIPMTSLVPGDRHWYKVEVNDPVTGEIFSSNGGDYFILGEGFPDVVHVSSSLTRDDEVWVLETTCRNQGTDAAFFPGWTCTLKGLLPVDDPLDSNWDSLVVGDLDQFTFHVSTPGPLHMGQELTFRTTLRPYLHQRSWTGTVDLEEIDYQDRAGNRLVAPTERTLYSESSVLQEQFAATDYVILTCPQKLYDVFVDPWRTANLLISANRHALWRGGFLALARRDRDRGQIRSWVNSRFSSRLSEEWKGSGNLTILGEIDVIPAFYWRSTWVTWEDSGTLIRARHFDQYWADTRGDDYGRPELNLGRIIGDTPGELQLTLQYGLTPSYRDKTLIMTGTGNRASDVIRPSGDSFNSWISEEMGITEQVDQLDGTSDDDLILWFKTRDGGADIVGGFFHGDVGGWSAMSTGNVLLPDDPVDFGIKHPLVFSPACLTGRYWEETLSLAEAFLLRGAAVYIGATSTTPLSTCESFTRSVGRYLSDPEKTFGHAFRLGKRHFANNNDAWKEFTRYTAYVMNYYGDPGRPVHDVEGGFGGGGADFAPVPLKLDDGPLLIRIPEPTFEDYGSFQRVFLGDSGTFEESERPIVPIHTERIVLAPGERVVDLTLERRGSRSEGSHLRLTAPMFTTRQDGPPDPVFPDYAEFWPAAEHPEFEWTVNAISEGKQGVVDELLVSIRPFHHNPATGEWYLHRTYEFEVETVDSPVTITAIHASPAPSSLADSRLDVMAQLASTVRELPVLWVVRLLDEERNELVRATGDVTIEGKEPLLQLSLPLTGVRAGACTIEVELLSKEIGPQSTLLHRDGVSHVHGRSGMVFEETSVNPDEPCLGSKQTVTLRAQVLNSGETVESGEIHAVVRERETDTPVAFFSEEFKESAPGERLHFERVWQPGVTLWGDYRVVFRVDSEGGSAPVRARDFSGCRRMEIAVVPDADSYTQCQMGIIRLRATSDGKAVEDARYAATVRLPSGITEILEVFEHPLGWAYVLYPFSPEEGEGSYEFTGIANADGYRRAESACRVVLSRNPAALWPRMMHAPADGETTVLLDLGPVYVAHGWNPLLNRYWDGRARHGADPISGDPWQADPPPAWEPATHQGVPLTIVPDGTLVTLSSTAGEIVNADVDGSTPGVQVRLTGGRTTVQVRAPGEEAVAYVLAETPDAESLGFTRVTFPTTDPNGNGHSFCVGDLRRMAFALRDASTAPGYRPELDLDASGVISPDDVMEGVARWTGTDSTRHAEGASGVAAVLLRGDWEQATPGGTFTIRIDIRSGEPISGLEVLLEHDPAVLGLESFGAGQWFAEGFEILDAGPVEEPGTVKWGVLRRDRDDPGIIGEGTVLEAQARVLGQGEMGLALRGAVATRPDGRDVPVILIGGDHSTVSEPPALRGDANADGQRDISDPITILDCLFLGGDCPSTLCAGDSNDDGKTDISDAVFLLSFLFLGGEAPAACR